MPAKQRYSITTIKRSSLTALACLALVVVVGCGSFNVGVANPASWITPYRIDVIQGNFISKEQVESLKAGMSRAQVKELLGTSLVSSLFHADRWDYVFTLKRQGVEPQSFKYTVFFKAEQLERFEGDTMPSNAKFVASLVNTRKIGKIPVLEATEAQLKAAETPSATTASANTSNTPSAAPAGSQAVSYPPLESAKP